MSVGKKEAENIGDREDNLSSKALKETALKQSGRIIFWTGERI